jgi:hypothetical protein
LDDTFGIHAITRRTDMNQGGFLCGVMCGVGDTRAETFKQRGFIGGIGAEDHHRAPAKSKGADGGQGSYGHRVRQGGTAWTKATMVQPFAQNHSAGAQQGTRYGISLVRAGSFGGTRRFLHGTFLAQIAARWYESSTERLAHHALGDQEAPPDRLVMPRGRSWPMRRKPLRRQGDDDPPY